MSIASNLSFSTATSILAGTAGAIVYQSGVNTTAFLSIGTNGYVLTSNGSSPTWSAISGLTAGNATTATNIAAGTAGQLVYQSAPGVTAFAGPGTAGQILVSAGTSAPTYTNTSSIYINRAVLADTASAVTNSVTFNNGGSGGASGTTFNGSAAQTISYNTLGAMPTTGGTFTGPVTFNQPVTFGGTATYVLSTNTFYTDNIIELHVPPSGVNTPWFADDGKDIGLRFHYYRNSTDTNAALVLDNTSGYLDWYSSGAESSVGDFSTATYGVFRSGSIKLVGGASNSGNTTTGDLTVLGGVGVGGGLFVGGIITATNFSGSLSGGTAMSLHYQSAANTTAFLAAGSAGQILQTNGTGSAPTWVSVTGLTAGTATTSTQVNTQIATASATYYPTFVDSNNASATGELVYTTSSFTINPSTGAVGIGYTSAQTNGLLQVAGGIGIAANSTVRQATNTDGGTLKFYGTQFVAAATNSGSYGYAGSGQLASVSSAASAVMLDVGGQNTGAGHRLKVINDGTGITGYLYYGQEGGSTATLYANAATGNVGIGTTSPASVFHVRNGSLFPQGKRGGAASAFFFENATVADLYLELANTVTNYSGVLFSRAGTGNYGLINYNNATDNMVFYTSGTVQHTITSAGGIAFGSSQTAYGTSGQILQSNGNAPPTWVAPTGLSAGSVANALTMNNAGSGDASGTTFNGGTARTLSYNTIGATAAGTLNDASSTRQYNGHISADTRSSNYAPGDRTAGFYADFKANTTDSLSDGGTYHGVLTFRPYGSSNTDFTGGQAQQIATTDNNNLWHRMSTNSSTWGTWQKIIDTGNTGTAYVNRAVIADSSAGSSSQVNTTSQPSNSSYFLTFVDANNASAAAEIVYTTSSFVIRPGLGYVGINTSSPSGPLVVSNAGAAGIEFFPSGSGVSSGPYFNSYNRSTSQYVSWANYALTHTWYVGTGGATRALDIDSSGNMFLTGGTTQLNTGFTNKLNVSGSIVAGALGSTNGTILLQGNYGTGSITNIGTEYSSGGPVVGYGVYPSNAAAGAFFSSTGAALNRGAYTISGNQHNWYVGASQTVAIGSAATMTLAMSLTSTGALAFNGASNYGSSGQVLQSNGNAAPTWVNQSAIAAGSAPLTSTYVGYGSASNLLTGSSALTWNGTVLSSTGYANFTSGMQVGSSAGLTFGASKWMVQGESTTLTRSYACGPDTSTYGSWEHYTARSNGTPVSLMRWDANGNVGIGTSSPPNKLTISNNGSVGLEITPTGGYTGLGGVDLLAYNRGSAVYAPIGFITNASNNSMVILTNGNVGVATTTPGEKLTVNGSFSSVGYTNIGGTTYISGTNPNTLNSGYSTAADGADLWINYRGYLDGQSYFRNFNIGNGKGGNILWASGPTGNVGIGTGQAASYRLDFAPLNSTTDTFNIRFGINNGPGTGGSGYGATAGGGTSLGTGIVWVPNYTGYTKRSAGILQIAEGNYFRSGLAFYTNNIQDSTTDWTEAMRIGSNGNVSIGQGSAPALLNKFDVYGTNGQLFSVSDSFSGTIFAASDISGVPSIEVLDTGLVKFAQYNGSVAISTGTAVAGSALSVYGIVSTIGSASEIRGAGEITAYYSSDERLKENINVISNPIEIISQIRGVFYDWTDEQLARRGGEDGYFVRKHDIGVIAQEVEKVLPEIVATRDDGYKAVRYEKLVPLLIESIKSQQAEIDTLKYEMNEMRKLFQLLKGE